MKKLLYLLVFLLPLQGFSQYGTPRVVEHNIRSTYVPQHVGLPLEAMEKALKAKQAQYDASVEDCKKQAVELYNAKNTAPAIGDGKHKVTLIGLENCEELTVIVDKTRVFSIPLSDGSYIKEFTISTKIEGCKSKIGFKDKETGVAHYFDVLFLEDLYKD